jgi:hypothetical protein
MTEHKRACCSSPAAMCYWLAASLIASGLLSLIGIYWRPLLSAWDYIAVYKPAQIWTDAPPQPEFTGRPVVRFIEGTRRALNTIYSEQKKLN